MCFQDYTYIPHPIYPYQPPCDCQRPRCPCCGRKLPWQRARLPWRWDYDYDWLDFVEDAVDHEKAKKVRLAF